MKYADSTNQHTAKIRAGRLLNAWLTGDRDAYDLVLSELADRDAWARVATELSAWHWVELLRRFDATPNDEDKQADADAYLDAERDHFDEIDPDGQVAYCLRLTAAVSEYETALVNEILNDCEDFAPVVPTMLTLIVAQAMEDARALLLGRSTRLLFELTGELPAAPSEGSE